MSFVKAKPSGSPPSGGGTHPAETVYVDVYRSQVTVLECPHGTRHAKTIRQHIKENCWGGTPPEQLWYFRGIEGNDVELPNKWTNVKDMHNVKLSASPYDSLRLERLYARLEAEGVYHRFTPPPSPPPVVRRILRSGRFTIVD